MANYRAALATAVVVLMTGCGGSSSTTVEDKPATDAPAKPGTPLTPVLAKAHLADAAGEAKKWRGDAVVIQVAGSRVPDDGKKAWWDYGAWSPSAKRCLVITFIRGNVTRQESGGEECESEPLGEIIDSDEAIKTARANGVTKTDVSMVAMASPGRKGQSIWTVIEEGMRNPGNITLDIDAGTGKVLNTTRNP